ncbi:unnamed protein product [Ectocarpus sp. 6 AP-2014]
MMVSTPRPSTGPPAFLCEKLFGAWATHDQGPGEFNLSRNARGGSEGNNSGRRYWPGTTAPVTSIVGHVEGPADSSSSGLVGTCVGPSRSNEADRMDMLRGIYRGVYCGFDLRATPENSAGPPGSFKY